MSPEKLTLNEALVVADAEKPLREIARQPGVPDDEKKILDKYAVNEGDKASKDYKLFNEQSYTDRGWTKSDARYVISLLDRAKRLIDDHNRGTQFESGMPLDMVAEYFEANNEQVPPEVIALVEKANEVDPKKISLQMLKDIENGIALLLEFKDPAEFGYFYEKVGDALSHLQVLASVAKKQNIFRAAAEKHEKAFEFWRGLKDKGSVTDDDVRMAQSVYQKFFLDLSRDLST